MVARLSRPFPAAEAWADALHRWLNLTEDNMHIVNTGECPACRRRTP